MPTPAQVLGFVESELDELWAALKPAIVALEPTVVAQIVNAAEEYVASGGNFVAALGSLLTSLGSDVATLEPAVSAAFSAQVNSLLNPPATVTSGEA